MSAFNLHSTRIRYFILIFLCSHIYSGYSQTIHLRGTIKSDRSLEPLEAIITLGDSTGKVISYTQSDQNGSYRIDNIYFKPGLWLEVNVYGFHKARQAVLLNQMEYIFILKPNPLELQEVRVEAPAVRQTGDTTRFNVQRFAREQDRSISDVLKRLPGIGVGDDGSITYNGKKIDNLYIHGDDLMGGRYGMATKTIKKEMISSVHIIQNHQPVKALQNKVHSDKISVDLILQDDSSLKSSGNLRVGAGIPNLYELDLAQVALNKKFKMLNAAGGNTLGINYEDQLKNLGSNSMMGSLTNKLPEIYINLGATSKPSVPPIYYLNNRSLFASINNLYKFKNEVQLRINTTSQYDKTHYESSSAIANFVLQDTIRFTENHQLTNKPWGHDLLINLMANKKLYFLNNSFKVIRTSNLSTGEMHFNDQKFSQALTTYDKNYTNEFTFIPTYRKNSLVELRWLLEQNRNGKNLHLGSGYRPNFASVDSASIIQNLLVPTFISNSYLAYTYAKIGVTQQYKAGYMYEEQKLHSRLYSNTGLREITDSQNGLDWQRSYPYFSAMYQVRRKKMNAEILLPLEYYRITFQDLQLSMSNKRNFFLFRPKLYLQYNFSTEKNLRFDYNFQKSIGDFTQIYTQPILLDFKTLMVNDPHLQILHNTFTSLQYKEEQSLSMLTFYGKTIYTIQRSNTIKSMEIEENIIRSKTIKLVNRQKILDVNGGISKFFWKPKFRMTIDASGTFTKGEHYLNGNIVPLSSFQCQMKGQLEKNILKRLSAEYSYFGSWFSSRAITETGTTQFKNQYTSFQHNFSLSYLVGTQWQAKLSGIQSRTLVYGGSPIKYLFMNLNGGYRTKNKRVEWLLEISNIMGEKQYEIFTLMNNTAINRSYPLKGRTTVIKVIYNI
ncbi:TonB-dependent receptor plug [Leadbetterella byssophila DSM 17132]|uniref:TonB-dependent receptor plug n=1 Tax=Leadbetterella byssophila (strain DSM 17132 / JCM 16389 / KACC 11308 / NBRC 106382 / 4M15) TaxID=649349 RepID=E4RV22_LEAB4|nr:TonB-dependent receptor plug [Leadbetterella byssophila]ADQ17902.1 TonB-dependent receptor plug [Leadbetterella byssophila DSM 17132]